MSFMEMDVFKGDGWIARTDNGDVCIPDWNAPDVDALRGKIGEKVWIGELCGTLERIDYVKSAWWGRYTAPGYLDCTEWNMDTNRRRLEKTLRDYYGDAD